VAQPSPQPGYLPEAPGADTGVTNAGHGHFCCLCPTLPCQARPYNPEVTTILGWADVATGYTPRASAICKAITPMRKHQPGHPPHLRGHRLVGQAKPLSGVVAISIRRYARLDGNYNVREITRLNPNHRGVFIWLICRISLLRTFVVGEMSTLMYALRWSFPSTLRVRSSMGFARRPLRQRHVRELFATLECEPRPSWLPPPESEARMAPSAISGGWYNPADGTPPRGFFSRSLTPRSTPYRAETRRHCPQKRAPTPPCAWLPSAYGWHPALPSFASEAAWKRRSF